MKEVTRDFWKRFGYFWLSFVPLLIYLALSVGVSLVVSIFIIAIGILRGEGDIITYVLEESVNQTMLIGTIYAVLAMVAIGLWYYFGCKQKKIRPPKGVLSPANLGIMVVLAFFLQYVVSYLMALLGVVMPNALEKYAELVEMAGIGEVTVLGILYGVILGPIAEELCFRGLTLHFARKFTNRFWLANMLQAALFGLFHMNLIQGIYAFVLGLVMGWIYKRYNSLYASMWFHIAFNFMAFGPMELIDGLLPQHVVFQIIWAILMCALSVFFLRMIKKRTEAEL